MNSALIVVDERGQITAANPTADVPALGVVMMDGAATGCLL